LLPAATIGHLIGLRFHERIVHADQAVFYRVLGSTLLLVCIVGILSSILLP